MIHLPHQGSENSKHIRLCLFDGVRTGLGEFKNGDFLITIMHNAVNAAARITFPTKFPFLFGST